MSDQFECEQCEKVLNVKSKAEIKDPWGTVHVVICEECNEKNYDHYIEKAMEEVC